MSSRPSSTASTIGKQAPPPGRTPLDHEREFLADVLGRLSLSRPCTPALSGQFWADPEPEVDVAHDDPGVWHSFSAASSVKGAARPSDTSGTAPLLSEARAYADSVVLATLNASVSGEDGDWGHGTSGMRKRLVFYQALLVQFVHICIPHYLAVVRRGGCVATEVEQFRSVKALREFLHTGSKKSQSKKLIPSLFHPPPIIPRDLAKSEMLSPFLIEVY
ncbi:hypothetical protein JCM3770_000889 [Rhodotorula araucariae]